MLPTNSGNIAVTVTPKGNGHFLCQMTLSLNGETRQTGGFHGQNPDHAIAVALEDLAQEFRMAAEAEQKLDWEAVDRSPSGELMEKRFHVILHYERVANEESKFEAMHNTLLGNTIVENAEVSIVQVDPELPIAPWEDRRKRS